MILPELSHEWKTGLSLAWSGYIAVLSIWIVMQKRAPVSTMSWILSLALLPFAGFVIYHFLGPQRLRKQRLKRLRSRAGAQAQADVARLRDAAQNAPPALQQMAKLGTATCGLPVSSAVDVELLSGGARTFDAIFEAVRDAQNHIHLEYYIFEPDKIGTGLARPADRAREAGRGGAAAARRTGLQAHRPQFHGADARGGRRSRCSTTPRSAAACAR